MTTREARWVAWVQDAAENCLQAQEERSLEIFHRSTQAARARRSCRDDPTVGPRSAIAFLPVFRSIPCMPVCAGDLVEHSGCAEAVKVLPPDTVNFLSQSPVTTWHTDREL